MRRTLTAFFTVILILLAVPAAADLMPHNSIVQMCLQADVIVEGSADEEGNGFTVGVVHHAPGRALRPGDRITVGGLSDHQRLFGHAWQEREAISTRRAMLFLNANASDSGYTPISFFPESYQGQIGGSRGLLWWDDDRCMGYAQMTNPGPYVLTNGEDSHGTADIEALRAGITEGLAIVGRWHEIQAIEGEADRAAAIVAAWQANDGLRPLFTLRREMVLIGQPAVGPLIGLLESSDNTVMLNDVVLSLYDIGRHEPEAVARATGLLCDRLADPGPTARYYILSALTSTCDPAAIPAVRPMLTDEAVGMQVRVQAAEALAAMGDHDAFDTIAAMVDAIIATPRVPGHRHSSHIRDLLNALYRLDPERAEAPIERVKLAEGWGDMTPSIRGYRRD